MLELYETLNDLWKRRTENKMKWQDKMAFLLILCHSDSNVKDWPNTDIWQSDYCNYGHLDKFDKSLKMKISERWFLTEF